VTERALRVVRERVEDLVVVVPGILGSRLAAADGREVWGTSGRAIWGAIRSFGGVVKDLRLPSDLGDDGAGDGIVPVGLMPGVHALPNVGWPVEGYSGLLGWLEGNFSLRRALPGDRGGAVNLVAFAYDWRLSNRYNARRLEAVVDEALGRWRESAPHRAQARVTFLCHSMGGLIVRYWAEVLGGFEVTDRIITLGTPHRGSLDGLMTLVGGMRLGRGRLSLDLTDFARSLPSLYQLAPDYACIESAGGLLYPREFAGLPGVDGNLLEDGGRFHAEIREAARRNGPAAARCLPIVGVRQPTATTARVEGDRLVALDTIDGEDEGGDGRVPQLSGSPGDGASALRPVFRPAEQHGSLQNNTGVRDAVWTELAPNPPYKRGSGAHHQLGVRTDGFIEAGAECRVVVTASGGSAADELAVLVTAESAETGAEVTRAAVNLGERRYRAAIPDLAPGAYRVRVRAQGDGGGAVTALVLVGDGDVDNA
jgi:Lecithin:cholesterol acyltransferase